MPGFGLILFFLFNAKLPKGKAPAVEEAKGSAFKKALLSPFTFVGIAMFFLTTWAMQCLYGLTGAYLAADRPLGAGYGAITARAADVGCNPARRGDRTDHRWFYA